MMKIRIMGVTDMMITHMDQGKMATLIIENKDSSGSVSHTVIELESDNPEILKEIKNGAVV